MSCDHYDDLYVTYRNTENILFLIDQSGGNGIYPEFEDFISNEQYKGFAGGLNPDNAEEAVEKILRLGDFDINMQAGVRTDNVFDLEKCRKVCEICAKYIL